MVSALDSPLTHRSNFLKDPWFLRGTLRHIFLESSNKQQTYISSLSSGSLSACGPVNQASIDPCSKGRYRSFAHSIFEIDCYLSYIFLLNHCPVKTGTNGNTIDLLIRKSTKAQHHALTTLTIIVTTPCARYL